MQRMKRKMCHRDQRWGRFRRKKRLLINTNDFHASGATFQFLFIFSLLVNIALNISFTSTIDAKEIKTVHTARTQSQLYDTTSCRDRKGRFSLKGDKYTCWNARQDQSLCTTFPALRKKCPLSCNSCCIDNPREFDSIYPDFNLNKQKTCSMIPRILQDLNVDLCEKSRRWRNECPVSCGICPCSDTVGKFELQRNYTDNENSNNYSITVSVPTWNESRTETKTSCHPVRIKQSKCRWDVYKEKCPQTCNTCPPKIRTYEQLCEIDAKLSFPEIEDAPYYGYHSDHVRVEKIGEVSKNSICGFENTNTSWGCEHWGVGRIFHNKNDLYPDHVEAEYVRIKGVRDSSFIFYLSHYFNSLNEQYYDGDHIMVGKLIIVPSRGKKGKFHHPKNTNVPTHKKDGSINPNYDGEIKIRVDCNDECVCKMHKIQES